MMDPGEERELALRARCGSLPAFEDLVRRYETRIFAFILTQCRNRADAQDLTQDTFVRAWDALNSWDDKRCFKSWLFAIARNKCIDHYRSKRLQPDSPAPWPAGLEPQVEAINPSELLERQEEGRTLWAIAQRVLGTEQYHCLWLRYAEDMEIDGVARVLGRSRTWVKVTLFRARTVLGRHLQRTSFAPGAELPCPASSILHKTKCV